MTSSSNTPVVLLNLTSHDNSDEDARNCEPLVNISSQVNLKVHDYPFNAYKRKQSDNQQSLPVFKSHRADAVHRSNDKNHVEASI